MMYMLYVWTIHNFLLHKSLKKSRDLNAHILILVDLILYDGTDVLFGKNQIQREYTTAKIGFRFTF